MCVICIDTIIYFVVVFFSSFNFFFIGGFSFPNRIRAANTFPNKWILFTDEIDWMSGQEVSERARVCICVRLRNFCYFILKPLKFWTLYYCSTLDSHYDIWQLFFHLIWFIYVRFKIGCFIVKIHFVPWMYVFVWNSIHFLYLSICSIHYAIFVS